VFVSDLQVQSLASYEREGRIGFITLNRPEKLNALNLVLWNAIGEAVQHAASDREARAIILRGEGKAFCAGLDLSPDNEILAMISGKCDATQKTTFFRAVKRLQQIHDNLERLPQPTIAAIHGHCIGAGLELALCCDIRLCSSETRFALPEAKLGIIADVGGLQRLPKIVGHGRAREMAFRSHTFDGQKAKDISLVNEIYPDKDSLNQSALEMAEEIAANPPLAVQGAKEVFLYNDNVSMDEALDYTAARSSMIMPSEDLFEAIAAYMQKRPPSFKGA
jgi:enoyl-CoA hydratase